MGDWLSTLVAVASVAASTPATATPRVVVLASEHASGGAFVENLRIQLTDTAEVALGPAADPGSARDKATRARLYLLASGASIAVWQERRVAARTGALEVVVLAVTRDTHGRPIEVARLKSESGDEADRILALKVGELLHQVLAAAKSDHELAEELRKREQPVESEPPAKPRPKAKSAATAPAPQLRAFVEAGGGLRVDARFVSPQVGGKLLVGGAYQASGLRGELALGARRLTDLQVFAENGRVVLREVDLSLSLRGLWELSPLAFGAHLGLAANRLEASAVSLDGRRGGTTKIGTSWTVGPEARLRLASILEMRAQVVLEPTMYAQRFAIEGIKVPSGPGTHVAGELSLILSTR